MKNKIHLSWDFILWGFEAVVSSIEAVRLNFLPGLLVYEITDISELEKW